MIIKTSDGFELDSDFQQKDSDKCVVFAHGITVNKDEEGIFVRACSKLNKLNISTLRFSFRGHGKSSGESKDDFSISGQLTDLDAVMSFVRSKGMEIIGLAGASFGGGASSLYAGSHLDEIDALFLANPVLDYTKAFLKPTTSWAKKHFTNLKETVERDGCKEIGSRKFAIGMKLVEEMSVYRPDLELEKYQRPILVAHGTEDTKVACADVVAIVDKLSKKNVELRLLEGSEHGFAEEPYQTEVVEMIVRFFEENL
jgi:uncharacterized protein